MSNYSYSQPQRGYLDTLYDGFWNQCARLFATYLPSVTPNVVTLLGTVPIYLTFILYISNIISLTTVTMILAPLLIFYLHMDAIDGKLARLTNRSSPIGQILDHGCDALVAGIICALMCVGDGEYHMRVLTYGAVLLVYIGLSLSNIHEHYTGQIVLGIGRINVTEVLHIIAILMLVYYYMLSVQSIYVTYLLTGFQISSVVVPSVLILHILRRLLHPFERLSVKEPDQTVKHFNMKDHTLLFVNMMICLCIASMTCFSIYELSLTTMYLTSSVVDIIYCNVVKSKTIQYDYVQTILIVLKLCTICLSGTYIASFLVDLFILLQITSDKMTKIDDLTKFNEINKLDK